MKQDLIWIFLPKDIDADMLGGEKKYTRLTTKWEMYFFVSLEDSKKYVSSEN